MAEPRFKCEFEDTPEGAVCTLTSPDQLHQDTAAKPAVCALAQHLKATVQAELVYFVVASSGTRCALRRVIPAATPSRAISMWPDKR